MVLIALTFPPLVTFTTEKAFLPETRNDIAGNKDSIKAWLSFASLSREITTAALVSGAVYAERMTSGLKSSVRKYQETRARLLGERLETLEDRTEIAIKELADRTQKITKATLIPNLIAIETRVRP